jgi:predicted  nucleic acid-binding Zn-ribbon protein
VEKAWQSAVENVKQLQASLRGHKAVQRALAQSQRQVSGLSAQLDAARQEAAAAQSTSKAVEALRSRSAVLEKAWTTALEDARALQAQSRDLRAALSQSQREASLLASELERTAAQLAGARQAAAEAQATAATVSWRWKLREKAGEAALWRQQEKQ